MPNKRRKATDRQAHIVQVWRERHKRPWWRDTEDDYIDLRPRIQTGRRKWR